MLPGAELHRPIERGDVAQVIRDGVHVLGIIDGEFQHARAASPSELMDALRSGMRVYGSSSIGALRAVELERYGMIGVGAVFDLVKDTPGFRDDFVATTGEGRSYAALALNARRLVGDGALAEPAAHSLCEHYARLHFTRRNERALCAAAPELAAQIQQVFAAGDPLRNDGLALLARIATDLRHIAAQNQRISLLQQGDHAARR